MAKHTSREDEYTLRRNVIASLKLNWQINHFSLISYATLALLQVVSSVLTIFFTSRIIGELTLAVRDLPVNKQALYIWLALSVASVLAERFAWRWLSLLERQMWIRWYVRMTVDFNNAIANLSMEQHHDSELQKMLTKLVTAYQYIPQNYAAFTLQLFHSCARLMSSLIIVLGFAPLLAPLLLASLIPNFITERRLSKLQWNLWGERGDKNRLAWRLTYYLQEKDKLQETKIFQTQQFLTNKLRSLLSDFYSRQLKNLKRIRLPAFGSLAIEGVVLAGINIWLILRVVNHDLSLANFTFYSGIILQYGSSLSLIVNSLSKLIDDNEYMRDMFKLFALKPTLSTPDKPARITSQSVPEIEFQNVWFRYPGSEGWALQDLSFSIKPAEKIAFVGENGAGKTTIIRLLLRFYDVNKGTVLLNGIDIRKIDLATYYRHIAVLFQDFNDYPLDVRDNIALGRVEHFDDDEAVFEAAKQADADEFIQKYPNKYEQTLEVGFSEGVEPSGGQWQRIALARVLFRDAGILILDEPTAAVDAKSEYAIFKTLEKHSKNKTTIIISHRFSTVRTAKKIYVIEHGKLIENGSHSQLMKIENGRYHEMFEKQAEGYR